MINVEEIRINNYIKPVGDFPYWKVTSKDILYLEKNPSEYEFIPLTEEWLIKFGFQKIGKNFRKLYEYNPNLKEFVLFYNHSTGFYEIKVNNLMCTILLVHQLQNLYFVLTNEELKIQLINSDIKK